MSACCRSAVSPQVVLLDQIPVFPSSRSLFNDNPLCSLPALPSASTDLKGILVEIRNEFAALAIRQEDFFTQLLHKQQKCQEGIAAVQSTAEIHMEAQVTMNKFLRDLLAEVHGTLADATGRPFAADSNQTLHPTGPNNDIFVHEVNSEGVSKTEESNRGSGSYPSRAECSEDLALAFAATESVNSPIANGTRLFTESSDPSCVVTSDASKRLSALAFRAYQPRDDGDQSLKVRFNNILTGKEFELLIAFAIISNAFIMFWEGQYQGLDVGFRLQYPERTKQAHIVWANAETAFMITDWAFGILFVLEAIAKIACWKLVYFCDAWNNLDMLCVITFLFDKFLSANAGVRPQMLRLLRLFRLVRLLRLLRFLENLDHLYVMTTAISALSKVLAWAAFLLTAMLVACDLFVVQLLHATYFDGVVASDLTEDELRKHQDMYAHFGTCTRGMLSMFEITLGNWPPIARLLAEEVSEWCVLFCLVHKLTIGFAVIGVINGVILQETFKVSQTDDIIMLRQRKRDSKVLRVKMEKLFQALDSDNDGHLYLHEFEAIRDDPNVEIWLKALDVETDDLVTLFHLIDSNHSGCITLDEIVNRMPRIRGAARSMDVLALKSQIKGFRASLAGLDILSSGTSSRTSPRKYRA